MTSIYNRETPLTCKKRVSVDTAIEHRPGRGRGRDGHRTGHCKVQTGRSAGRPRGGRAVGSIGDGFGRQDQSVGLFT